MTEVGSVEGRERLRLFCALRLPEAAFASLCQWQAAALGQGGRVVPRDNLHFTLAFLGHRPASEVEPIVADLRHAAGTARRIRLSVRGYRETRSVGMLTFEDEGGAAAALAEELHGRLERLGVYVRERRPWLPHLTVLRFRKPPRLHPPLPDLGVVNPSEAALYHSVLRRGGAHYEVLESVALGGSSLD
jgi:RNA 2',3'-cyclic 3'-phosphodiesterase